MATREQREADAVHLIDLLVSPGGLPLGDPLRSTRMDDLTGERVPAGALRRPLEDKLFAWVDEGYTQREPGDPPLGDRLFHGSRSDREKEEPTALDVLVEGLPTADRVRLRRAARLAGYVRPWGRGAGLS